jgi:hypothetical protein
MTRLWKALMLSIIAGASTAGPLTAARGQEAAKQSASDLLVRIKGPLAIEAGDSVGGAWVFGSNARVTGTVRERLLVVNGDARIEGAVRAVTIVNGHLELGPTARVAEDVLLYRSTVTRAPGATVGGAIHTENGASFSASALWVLWASVTLAMIVAGLVLVRLVTPALDDTALTITRAPAATLLTTALLVLGLPAAAILAFMSGIGFVLGFLIVFVVIPVSTFFGIFVSALALGRALLDTPERRRSPYTGMGVGVFVLQLLGLIPVAGMLAVIVAGQIGAAAFVYRTWRRQRSDVRRTTAELLPA